MRRECHALPDPSPHDLFDLVHVEKTPELAAQQAGYAAYVASFEGGAA
jgi:2-oxoisovalerate dehydrogenase E1 component alpha subunit